MFASVTKYLTATGTKSVVASITVHALVLGVAGWSVVNRPLDRFRLPGKPIALSVEIAPDEVEPMEVAVMPSVPVAKSVIVLPDRAIVQDTHYHLSPSVEPLLSDAVSPSTASDDLAETEDIEETQEDDLVESPSKENEEVELTELSTDTNAVARAQRERRAKKKESLGNDETAPDLSRSTPPVYPAEARRSHLEGTVLLSVSISATGTVTSVVVHRTSGHPILDAAAVNAVRQWRGVPRMRAGVAVESVETLPIVFRLR